MAVFGQPELLEDIGGTKAIVDMCDRFYTLAFQDYTLDKFIEKHEEPHGERLGTFIAEKLGGDIRLWTLSRPYGARQTAHSQAWHSSKREPGRRGRRFKVEDCRVWMRLFFRAVGESGLAGRKDFVAWIRAFVESGIGIYEANAPMYVGDSWQWAQVTGKFHAYVANGRKMIDVLEDD